MVGSALTVRSLRSARIRHFLAPRPGPDRDGRGGRTRDVRRPLDPDALPADPVLNV